MKRGVNENTGGSVLEEGKKWCRDLIYNVCLTLEETLV